MYKDDGSKIAVVSFTTDENGYGISPELPLGKYYLQEKQAPTGFILSDKKHRFELTAESNPVISFNLKNTANQVVLTKVGTDGKALTGATIQVLDESGKVFFEGKTNTDGKIILTELPVGKYTFKEVYAPIGYARNPVEFTFSINEYGKITGDTQMKDEPITVIVEKKDSYNNAPMPCVTFKLVDSDKKPIKVSVNTEGGYLYPDEKGSEAFKLNDSGKAIIKYLPVGNYELLEEPPSGYISSGSYKLTITDEHGESNPYHALIYNAPTALRLFKIHNKTKTPVTGAGFSFKVKDGLFFKTLKFTQLENGYYKADENGKLTTLMVDSKGELTVLGLPLGEVWIEESVVPKGYFPAPPVKVVVTNEHVIQTPIEVKVENAPFVKLGLDTDKYNPLIAIGLCLLGVGIVTWRVIARRRKNKLNITDGTGE